MSDIELVIAFAIVMLAAALVLPRIIDDRSIDVIGDDDGQS